MVQVILNHHRLHSHLITFHWILYIIFQSSMLLVTMVQHSIAFIVAWEIMSLSSFLLVLFDYTNPKVLKAGINYLVQMHLSVILLTVAFIWVYFKTGTFDFKGIGSFFGSNVNIWLFLIFFAGFGLKQDFLVCIPGCLRLILQLLHIFQELCQVLLLKWVFMEFSE